ncbi:hypothetical protein ES332_D07G127700v1 [Gossypium tomentosum]|uniref:Uncharacterized protein n=1 Tax=Gossypium tomentosum TaxID=34277 RepID=A0A5D2K6Z6_GOSTO|nr:hypothetical protein ES332_D07G127700v1 [Gossypium tomentosum]
MGCKFPKRFSSICYHFQISFLLKTLQSGFLAHSSCRSSSLQILSVPTRHAYASARNGDEILEWRVVFKALNSPRQSRTITPDADLYLLVSKAVSKCIVSCVLASQCL